MIMKIILKSFDFQCDFDFQITTSKRISNLNHLHLGDLILILKSSTYDDFAHLWAVNGLIWASDAKNSNSLASTLIVVFKFGEKNPLLVISR